MLDVILGTILVLILLLVGMAAWGRVVASRIESPGRKIPGNKVVPKAEKTRE
jgi:hypothetical protein